ncbi:MAG: phosphatase PAP2 family protein, partial [Firmicutes bacterium]|nr:phosphatase PAP2 family protein [Bacillota bacterium]
ARLFQKPSAFDLRTVRVFAELRGRSRFLDRLMRAIAQFGPGLFFIEMLFLLVFSIVDRQALGQHGMLATVALAVLGALATKAVIDQIAARVGRVRPFVRLGFIPLIGKSAADPSFPSNHAGGAFSLAVCLALHVPSVAAVCFAIAVLLVFARLYVGVHYVSDIVAGALIGALIGAICGIL